LAETLKTFTAHVNAIDVNRNGTLAVIAAETELAVWDLATDKAAANLGGLAQMISCLSLEMDNKALVADTRLEHRFGICHLAY
jgi:hypothetical protein